MVYFNSHHSYIYCIKLIMSVFFCQMALMSEMGDLRREAEQIKQKMDSALSQLHNKEAEVEEAQCQAISYYNALEVLFQHCTLCFISPYIPTKPLHNRDIVSVHFNHFPCMGICTKLSKYLSMLTYIYLNMDELINILYAPAKV